MVKISEFFVHFGIFWNFLSWNFPKIGGILPTFFRVYEEFFSCEPPGSSIRKRKKSERLNVAKIGIAGKSDTYLSSPKDSYTPGDESHIVYRQLKFLLDAGADVDLTDWNGMSAVHYCALNGQFQMLQLLLPRTKHNAVSLSGETVASGLTYYFFGEIPERIRLLLKAHEKKRKRAALAPQVYFGVPKDVLCTYASYNKPSTSKTSETSEFLNVSFIYRQNLPKFAAIFLLKICQFPSQLDMAIDLKHLKFR